MGNANQPANQTPPAGEQQTVSAEAAQKDAQHSEDPLFVLYGAPNCLFSVKAADLLVERQQHHCKIGTTLLKEVSPPFETFSDSVEITAVVCAR